MRKILIPTDFSENAMNAARYATELFKNERSEIYFIHAFADSVYKAKETFSREIFDDLKDNLHQDSNEKLEETCKEVLSFSPNPKHSLHIIAEFALLVDSVNDWVEKENIDIVIMGTKGETADKSMTFGSNTLQIIKYVNCPVLAIPAVFKDVHPKNILFPVDLQVPFKKRELKLLSSIAKCFVSNVRFLHFSKFPSLSLREQDNKISLEASFHHIRIHFQNDTAGNVTEMINNYIDKNSIDILVMVNNRHSYLENMLYQSTIEKIGLHINIPFLVLQNVAR